MNFKSPNNTKGFTLLEVLISIVILAFISLAIFQLTTKSYQLRDQLVVEGDFYSEIRLTVGLLERDIAAIYSPKLMIPDKTASKDGKTNTPQIDPNSPNSFTPVDIEKDFDYWTRVQDETGLRFSRFTGEEKSIRFITTTHQRIYKESRESIFSKVQYVLKPDDSEETTEKTQMLVKTENSDVFDYEDLNAEATKEYPLLHGIKKLKFRYYFKDKDQWADSWDSTKSDTRDIFPDIVEMQIEVIGPERHFFEGVYHFKPEIPLNGLSATF